MEITLRKKGKGPVLASDITDNPDIEIKNPNFCLATITNENTELVINMTVTVGRGYQQAQKRKFNEQDDLIKFCYNNGIKIREYFIYMIIITYISIYKISSKVSFISFKK